MEDDTLCRETGSFLAADRTGEQASESMGSGGGRMRGRGRLDRGAKHRRGRGAGGVRLTREMEERG